MLTSGFNSSYTGEEVDAAVKWVQDNTLEGTIKDGGPISKYIKDYGGGVVLDSTVFSQTSGENYPFKAVFSYSDLNLTDFKALTYKLVDSTGKEYFGEFESSYLDGTLTVTVYSNTNLNGAEMTLYVYIPAGIKGE